MRLVEISNELERVIDRHVAESEAAFLAEAVEHNVEALEWDDACILAVAESGIADLKAGRFITINGPEAWERLALETHALVDQWEAEGGTAEV
jgi:predicted transcriptional regulator